MNLLEMCTRPVVQFDNVSLSWVWFWMVTSLLSQLFLCSPSVWLWSVLYRQSQEERAGDEEDRDIKANQTRAAPPQQPCHQQAQEVPELHPSQPSNYSTSSIHLFQQTTTPPLPKTTPPLTRRKKWGRKWPCPHLSPSIPPCYLSPYQVSLSLIPEKVLRGTRWKAAPEGETQLCACRWLPLPPHLNSD